MHAADEFYLLAGDEPPAADAPEQYENGVGISGDLVAEAEALAAAWGAGGRRRRAGPAARWRHRRQAARRDAGASGAGAGGGDPAPPAGVGVRPFTVGNALFGAARHGHRSARRRRGAGGAAPRSARRREWLLAPRAWLPGQLGRTLDDVAEAGLAAACGGRLVVAETLGDAFARLSG